jgi:hypothetical protein
MKHLRQYIKQVLLTEAAKTPDLLPDDIVIWIDDEEGYDKVTIIYAEKAIPFRRMMPIGRPGDGITDKTGYPIWGRVVIEKTEDYGLCDGAMKVAVSRAAGGWGPLLYDVAIEYATQVANGLMSDRVSVSMAANHVWKYYLSNRSDVIAHQLDDPYDRLTPQLDDNCDQEVAMNDNESYDWEESPLSKRYTKEPTTITALKAAGKLVML